MEDNLNKKMEDELKNKMEDDIKNKNEDEPINLIGCDTIVNSPNIILLMPKDYKSEHYKNLFSDVKYHNMKYFIQATFYRAI